MKAGTLRSDLDPGRPYSLNVHWWDSNVILGDPWMLPFECNEPLNPGGSLDVWATGDDFGDAVRWAINYVEALGHRVDQVTVNI